MRRLILGRVLPALFPVNDTGEQIEAACLILTAIGTGYFTAHFIVAGVRAVLS